MRATCAKHAAHCSSDILVCCKFQAQRSPATLSAQAHLQRERQLARGKSKLNTCRIILSVVRTPLDATAAAAAPVNAVVVVVVVLPYLFIITNAQSKY